MRAAHFKGNIVVTNMPDNFTGSALAALFDDYGLVLGAVIEHPPGAEDRAPRGMVSLAPPSAVETAIQSLDGQVIDSHHLKVRKAPEQKKRAAGPKPATQPRRIARPEAARTAAPLPPPVAVRRAPIVERRSLGAPTRRVRFFDESKNGRG